MSEIGEVEETMDEAFGSRSESGTAVAVVVKGRSFPSVLVPACFRLRLQHSKKATIDMSAMSVTPPPTAPPMMALVGALDEVFLFHDLLLWLWR